MDNIVTDSRSEADDRFETARITAAVDALAEKYAGREDVFRSSLAQLLKGEMLAARASAQAILLKDRHGRRCAERLLALIVMWSSGPWCAGPTRARRRPKASDREASTR